MINVSEVDFAAVFRLLVVFVLKDLIPVIFKISGGVGKDLTRDR
jgi:hypothetical protein